MASTIRVVLDTGGVRDLLTDPGIEGACLTAAEPVAARARAMAQDPELEGGEAGVTVRVGSGFTRARVFISSALVMEARLGHLARALS